MNIELTLDKDFERTLDNLREKYGEEFEYINGVHPTQLDYSEFLTKFTQEKTLADSSIDPNANANLFRKYLPRMIPIQKMIFYKISGHPLAQSR